MAWADHRKNSRIAWGREVSGDSNPDPSAIKLGALLRIADATEAMAKRHTELMTQRDYYERLARERGEQVSRLVRQRTALRGTITRMKRAKQARGHE